ncbi:MAG: hypothetical protein OEY92_04250, partial [Elusimicrobiota bacterium]|nr:hypothetical protein [Elusimicrobiota bacterium]
EIPIEQNREILESLKTEKEILLKKPSGWEKQPQDSLPELVKSTQVIIPFTHHIRDEKVYIFYPLRDLQATFKEPDPKKAKELASWELIVADESGETFRKYSGRSLPPETILFDGRDKNGKVLKVGYPYSTILGYYDATGSLHTFVRNPFTISGFAHQEPEGFFISLDFKMLYRSPPILLEKHEFSDFGRELLQEASDWVKKHFFTFPINVIVYCRNKTIAEITAKEISGELARMLVRSEAEIFCQGEISEESLERIEIIVNNR